ncbi:flagellar hook-basal body complex protein FliE [Jannaschia sp.]|nr:flagellar hook-basal body complex protein FliE [Jannaschia sp.]
MDIHNISALAQGAGAAAPMPKDENAAMDAMRGFAQVLSNAETQSQAALTTGADPHDLVSSIAESQLAVDMVTTMRNKVVEAYQEILRMPV